MVWLSPGDSTGRPKRCASERAPSRVDRVADTQTRGVALMWAFAWIRRTHPVLRPVLPHRARPRRGVMHPASARKSS